MRIDAFRPALLLVLALVACSAPPAERTPAQRAPAGTAAVETAGAGTSLLAIPNARVPLDGVLSGGQPTPEQIAAAAAGGFRTVVNLRSPAEEGFEWEAKAVERAGMRYVHIPVAGGDGLTRDNVERIDAALDEALAEGPVLFHCASGNRIGAVLALREAWLEGAEPDAALELGLDAGLTRLEPKVREALGLPATPPPGG